jgi:hypothetical protein
MAIFILACDRKQSLSTLINELLKLCTSGAMVFQFLYRQFQYLLTLPWNLHLQIGSCLKVSAKIQL